MHARSGISHVDPAHLDEALAVWNTDDTDSYHASGGAKGGVLLINRSTGKMLGMSFWEDKAAMKASEEGADRLHEQVRSAGRGTGESLREEWEIVSVRWDGDGA